MLPAPPRASERQGPAPGAPNRIEKLGMRLRKRLPPRLRRVLRLFRHALLAPRPSPRMPPELIEGARLCASRYDLVRLLPREGRVAEVGTQRGAFARYILSASQPSELHLVDLDLSELDAAVRSDPRVRLHEMRSREALAGFEDASFDWIYIDADHSYAGASGDAQAAAPKVKPGGFLVFNDFAHVDPQLGAYGVHRAVVEFSVRERWPMRWLAYEPSALYDVALQRPL